MLVRWTPAAADDLEQVAIYFKQHYPEYAQSTVERLYAAAESLSRFTMRGRPGRQQGTRELVVTRLPYVVVYASAPTLCGSSASSTPHENVGDRAVRTVRDMRK